MRRAESHAGFTLVETLVATIIGAFIALVAVGALRAVTAGRTLVYSNIDAADELRYAVEMLRTDLENMSRDNTVLGRRFVGTHAETDINNMTSLRMRIISGVNARAGQPEGDVYEVEYFVGGTKNAPTLMRRLCPIKGNEEDNLTRGGMLTTIARNIAGFEVRYFDGMEWHMEWPAERNRPPHMVEATLAAVETDDRGRATTTHRVLTSAFWRMPPLSGQASESREGAGR